VWTLISPEKDKNAWARFKGIEVEDGESVSALPLAALPQWPSAYAPDGCHVAKHRMPSTNADGKLTRTCGGPS
jgi:hypothetical protein